MAYQLVLITPSEIEWRLDQRTKELGRQGISEARAALGGIPPPARPTVGALRPQR